MARESTVNLEIARAGVLEVHASDAAVYQEIPLARAQKLLQHSDPKFTANACTKTSMREAQEAVARLDLPEDT